MKSAQLGTLTSRVEVIGVSPNGIWMLLDKDEHFLSFEQFPWFQNAPVGDIFEVERPHPHHLHWPALDVDLHIDSLTHPERFPLVSKT